jgi:hypothetical protein
MFAGAVKVGAYGVEGNAKNFGDAVVGQFFLVVKDEIIHWLPAHCGIASHGCEEAA